MWLPRASISPSGEIAHLDADRRCAGAAELGRAVGRGEVVVLGAPAVHRQQRCGLGEAVDLDELPPELRLDPLDGRVGGGAPAITMRTRSAPGIGPSHVAAASRIALATAGAPHITVTPCCSTRRRISAPSILRMIMCWAPMPGDGVEHAPPVAVELRQRVQVDVAVVDAQLPAERGGVQPDVAMGELHALGPRRGAAGVVDGGRGVLVVDPGLRPAMFAAGHRCRCR